MNWTGIQKVKTFSHFFCGQKVWKYNISQVMQMSVWIAFVWLFVLWIMLILYIWKVTSLFEEKGIFRSTSLVINWCHAILTYVSLYFNKFTSTLKDVQQISIYNSMLLLLQK